MATSEVESDTDRKPLLTNGSFAYLLGQYGFSNYEVNVDWRKNYTTSNPNLSGHNILLSPFFVTLAGYFDDRVFFTRSAYGGNIWGSNASSEIARAQYLGYDSNIIASSYVWFRNQGFSHRFLR